MNANEVSLVRAVRGPVTLITVGVLFALNNFTRFRFEQTWPVILIVFGILSLLRRGTDAAYAPPANPPYQQPPYHAPPAPGAYVPPAPPAAPIYNAPPSAAGRGGFGTSAPPRAADTTSTPPTQEGGSI